MSDLPSTSAEIIALNQQLLEHVAHGRWDPYRDLCHDDLTCFEAETAGHLVEGLAFHRFYFPDQDAPEAPGSASSVTVTMVRPHLRWLGEDAVVLSYTRLTQRLVEGEPVTATCCETRLWQRRQQRWGLVHVHRS